MSEQEKQQAAIDFLNCWARMDLEAALASITDDAEFQPDPKSDVAKGREAIRAIWTSYFGMMASYDFKVRTILSAGSVVMMERVEWFGRKAGGVLELPIVAVFEFKDGKISAWRDYWDTSMMQPAAS